MRREYLELSEGYSEDQQKTNISKIRYCNYILLASLIILTSCRVFSMVCRSNLFSNQLPLSNSSDVTIKCATEETTEVAPAQRRDLLAAFHFAPHLLENASSLTPAYLRSKERSGVSVVLGVPTKRRQGQSYLRGTLYNLIENMNEEELKITLIIVCIGETDYDELKLIIYQIEKSFMAHMESGLIDIIVPPLSYYSNGGDRLEWHSKLNLDIAYLMAYAHTRGTFYVQLEDDILAERDFITSMRKFALIKLAMANPIDPIWFVLDFCPEGFVGKLFKCAELPYLITYIQIYYNDMSMQQLLSYFIRSTLCRTDRRPCKLEKTIYWQRHEVSLFQHIGSSTLKDKLQKLGRKHVHNHPGLE